MQQATFWDGRAAKYDADIRTHDSLYIRTVMRTKSLLTNSDIVARSWLWIWGDRPRHRTPCAAGARYRCVDEDD